MKKNEKIRLIISLVIIVGIALIFVIWSLPQSRIKRCMEQAELSFQNQQYEQALDQYRSATLIDPYYTEAYLGEITTCIALEDQNLLEQYYEDCLNQLDGISDSRMEKEKMNIVWIYSFSLKLYSEEPAKAIRALNRGVALTHGDESLIALLGDNAVTCDELLSANKAFYNYVSSTMQQQSNEVNGSFPLGNYTLEENDLLYYTLMANLDYVSDSDLESLMQQGIIDSDVNTLYDKYLSALIAINMSNLNYIYVTGNTDNEELLIDYTKAFTHEADQLQCTEQQSAYFTSLGTICAEYQNGNCSVSYVNQNENCPTAELVVKQSYGFSPIAKKLMIYLLSGAIQTTDSQNPADDLLIYVEETLTTEQQYYITMLQGRMDLCVSGNASEDLK